MRNPMTNIEDVVREAPSMSGTRHIIPNPLNIISSIGMSYQAITRKWLRPYSWITINRMKDGVQAYKDKYIGCRDTITN
jgi:hypothetical protein